MIFRLDGSDKPARLTFLDVYDDNGNYIGDKKKAKNKKSSSSKEDNKKEEHSSK